MKTLSLVALTAPIGTPAFAHGGAHLHPHGFELALGGLAALSAVVLIIALRK